MELKIKLELLEYFSEFFENTNDLSYFIGGGILRDIISKKKFKDLDIFFKSKESYLLLKNKMVALGYEILKENNFFTTFSYSIDDFNFKEIQLINKAYYIDTKSLAMSFDYNNCCIAIDNNFEDLYIGDNALLDIETKKLTINNITSPIGTFRRMIRFLKRGYGIDDSQVIKIALALNAASKSHIENKDYM